MNSLMEQLSKSMEPYRPTPWLINTHFHTIWGMRFRPKIKMSYDREQFIFEDKGNTYLDWFVETGSSEDTPIVIVCHTLGGGSREPCTHNLAAKIAKHGWRAVVANCRGSSGAKVTSRKLFNGYDISDLRTIITHIKQEKKPEKLFLAGFSLGSLLCARYCAEFGDVDGILCVSHVYDSKICTKRLSEFTNSFLYSKVILQKLRNGLKKCKDYFGEELVDSALKAKTLYEFDNVFTCRLIGKDTADEYYDLCRLAQYIPHAKCPILFFGSLDDSFTSKDAMPVEEVMHSNNAAIAYVKEGGHVSFCSGMNGKNSYVDSLAIKWFEILRDR